MTTALYPPGPRGKPLVGIVLDYRRDPLGFLAGVARAYGDVAHLPFGPFHGVLLSHPEDIRDMLVTHNRHFHQGPAHLWLKRALGEGLLTSENPLHLHQRRLMQPAFHRQRIAGYADIMTAYCEQAAKGWRAGERRDLAQDMMRLTLRIAGKTLFDTDIGTEAGVVGPATTIINRYTSDRSVQLTGVLLDKLPLPRSRQFRRARAAMDAVIYRLIAERRAGGRDHGDLLSMLMLARDEEGRAMPDRQVRDEVMTLMLAGHETTANALTWTWYLLSQHPEVEARFHAELDTVLSGRLPTVEDLPRLRYTEMLLSESLRLYPPAWGTSRVVVEAYRVGGYLLPPGTVVSAITHNVQRDPRFWRDPLRFDPERWTPEGKAALPRFAYFPFGGGPRQCIGEPFAWMEGTLLLATLGRRWRLRLPPSHRVVPEPLITLRPKGGMPMICAPRERPLDTGDRVVGAAGVAV